MSCDLWPVGLLELHGLLAGLLGEELPLLGDALQAVLHRLLATRALLPATNTHTNARWKENLLAEDCEDIYVPIAQAIKSGLRISVFSGFETCIIK